MDRVVLEISPSVSADLMKNIGQREGYPRRHSLVHRYIIIVSFPCFKGCISLPSLTFLLCLPTGPTNWLSVPTNALSASHSALQSTASLFPFLTPFFHPLAPKLCK
ncbi:BA75_01483T0 [Komagataella pastoris]|uniref:BA75_01483T0 n=1 Tax=Komagataella pastoris TaxID=4922 RepID=A0A1B2J6U4_PICPA|nr:BA75_01483T0 [Komagataella pastoris]